MLTRGLRAKTWPRLTWLAVTAPAGRSGFGFAVAAGFAVASASAVVRFASALGAARFPAAGFAAAARVEAAFLRAGVFLRVAPAALVAFFLGAAFAVGFFRLAAAFLPVAFPVVLRAVMAQILAVSGRGSLPAMTLSLRRAFEAPRLPPAALGLALALGLVALFLGLELALGRFEVMRRPGDPERVLDDLRLTLVHIAIAVYALTATVYAERARVRSLEAIAALTGEPGGAEPERSPSERRILAVVGALGVAFAVVVTLLGPGEAVYRPSTWDAEVVWHRVLAPLIGFATARLLARMVMDALALSRRARSLRRVDLLDLSPLAPLTRHGLTNAGVWLGLAAVFALFLVQPGYERMLLVIFVSASLAAGVGLMAPVWGARRAIQARKRDELAWCRTRLRARREALEDPAAAPGPDRLEELIAWEARIERVREWPFDSATLARFGVYLVIPLASWSGGALVERLIDALLD